MFKGNILVVEKDSFYASFYQKTLTKEGYQVFLAGDAAEALRLFGERPYEVVISDVVLKGGDGLSLLSELRRIAPRQDVVVITSMQSIRKAVEALKKGAADYLTKPVDAEELILLVNGLIGRQTISDEHSRLVGENVVFYEQLRVHQRSLGILARLDAERVVDYLLELAAEETRAATVILRFYRDEEDDFPEAGRRGLHPTAGEEIFSFESEALRAQFFQGRAILLDDTGAQHPEGGLEAIRAFHLPLLDRGKLLGALSVSPRPDDAPYRAYRVHAVRVLAEAGALALANARRFTREAARDLRDAAIESYSPAYFQQSGIKEVNIARRYGRSLSVVCLEIDNFARVKERIKESQVRTFLREFAAKLLEVSRETDVLSMLTEGSFAILVPETDYYGSLMLIKRIKSALREAVFSIDLKRELRPVVSCGSASFPRDGEQLVSLMRRSRDRLEMDRKSLVRSLGLERRSFWNAAAFLADAAPPEEGHAAPFAFVSLSTGEVDHIRNLFLDEAAGEGPSRGLVYIGTQQIDGGSFSYDGFSALADSHISVFVMGGRGGAAWTHPEITPVYLSDRNIRRHRFLLYVSEEIYFCLLCRPDGDNRWKGFHTADPLLVQELVGKLQERYLLQQRIG